MKINRIQMKMVKRFVIMAAVLSAAIQVNAVPAYPGWQLQTQPDGSTIAVRLNGDEMYHYYTNADGAVVEKDANGYWQVVEAKPSADKIRARRAASRYSKRRNVGGVNLAPRGLFVLVNFFDTCYQAENTQTVMDSMMNGANYTYAKSVGSAKRYFVDQSGGRYNPVFDVVGPVTLSKSAAYYGANDADGNDLHPGDMVVEACKLVKSQYNVDFTRYDNDRDGKIDFVYIIYAGKGEADGGAAETIWPHNWNLSSARHYENCTYSLEDCKVDGLLIENYACSGELDGQTGARNGIGTLCHEFSHVLGLPDFYDTNYGSNHENKRTPGAWDIMDSGSYNGDGHCPPNYSAFEKYFLGWTSPVNPGRTGQRLTLHAAGTGLYQSYQMNASDTLQPATTEGENYYIENRQQTGWDKYLPGHGLLVWYVNYSEEKWSSNKSNAIDAYPSYTIESATGFRTNIGSSRDPFPGAAGVSTWAGIHGMPLKDIREENGVVTLVYGEEFLGYTVNWSVDGEIVESKVYMTSGEDLEMPTVAVTPCPGMQLLGWTEEEDYHDPIVLPADLFADAAGRKVTGHVTYHAVFEQKAPTPPPAPMPADTLFATRMVDFLPAPGQLVGTQWAEPSVAYAIGETGKAVSLGGFGGYIVLEFGTPIVNDAHNPYGVDFTVNGNPLANDERGVWTEPGAVMVMKDENHNGQPDDTWYELAGSDYYLSTTKKNVTMTYYNPYYQRRHTIAYRMSDGTVGAIRTNGTYPQSYFPGDYAFGCGYDSVSYTGNLIRGCADLSTPSYIENYRAALFGYADNKGATLHEVHNPYTLQMASGGDGFDLDWAVDKDGHYVPLDTVQWVKVYTAMNQDCGWLGENSTEVLYAERVVPDPEYVSRNYYAHYIGIPQLKAVVGQEVQYEGLLFRNGRPCKEGTPKWSLSTDSCGRIDQTGKFTPTHTGEVDVYFTQMSECAAGDTIVLAADTVRLQVVNLTGVVLEMEGYSSALSNDSTLLFVGDYTYITAQSVDNIRDSLNETMSNRFVYDTYTWTTTHPEVGTIENGLFRAQKAGRTMLYAHSGLNAALCDSILVIVSDPAVTVKNNPVVLSYKTPQVDYGVYELFDASGATITIESVKVQGSKATVVLDDKGQSVSVNFKKDSFGTELVDFRLRAFRRTFDICQPFVYSAGDIQPADKRLLFVNGGVMGDKAQRTTLKAYNIVKKTTSTLYTFDAHSVQDMSVDGAFAYVAAENHIARINTANGELSAIKYVQDTSLWDDGKGKSSYGLNSKMAVYKNWLLVSRQNSRQAPEDGYNVRVYNKTDLSLVTKIPVSSQATDIAVVGTKAYVMITGGYGSKASSMAVLNLQTLRLEKEIPMGGQGVNAGMLIAKGNTLYAIRGNNGTVASAVLEFDTQTETFSQVETGLPVSYSSAPAAIDPMTGDSIMLASETGFVAYNTRSSETSDSEVMPTPTEGLTPMASTRDAETGKYYVAYGAWAGNGEGRIYNADFSSAGTFDGVGASPEAMAIGPATGRNDAPRPKPDKVKTDVVSVFEYDAGKMTKFLYKRNFSDAEDNFDNVYIKNWSRYADWITPDLTYEGGAKTIIRFPSDMVDKIERDSTVHIYAEAIDKYGANYAFEAYTITLRPAVYPIYAHSIADVMVQRNADDVTISLADAFTWQVANESAENLTFTKNVIANTNEDLVSTVFDGDDLTLSFSQGKTGVADITIEQTGTYQQSPSARAYTKRAESTLRVTVVDCPSGLDDTVGDGRNLVVYPTSFVDNLNIKLTESGAIRIYDLAGKCVAQVVGHAGVNTIRTSAWADGVYIIKFGDLTAKVVK